MSGTKPLGDRWGRQVARSIVAGHPCKVFSQRPHSVGEMLLDTARWSDRELLVQAQRRITGGDHLQAVGRVVRKLNALGIGPRDLVVLLGYNHLEWFVTFWAIQAVGATAVLANAWWSDDETNAMLETVRPSLVISDRPRERFPLLPDAAYLSFAELRPLVDAGTWVDKPLECANVDEEWPAVVIYSSGTSGKAKGVVMSHRAVIANIQNLLLLTGRLPSELQADHPGTVSLLTMPLFHLAGFQIMTMTMLSGGKLIFLADRFDPTEVLRLIEREQVRTWGCVPTMASRVIEQPEFAAYDTSSLSSVQMGGAQVTSELRTAVGKAFPRTQRRVGSLYGLTEAGGVLAAGAGHDLADKPGCVGRPLPSVEVVIRNPNAEGVGEIAARAPSAPSGYIGDPTSIADEEGWVLTGDLGRFDEAGYLYVVGRSKDTIIRAGENIACGHVEAVLRGHSGVLDAAVVPLPDPDLGEEVGAAIVIRSGVTLSADQLRSFVATKLAKFEVPSRWWLRADPLPTNASGKTLKSEIIATWPSRREDTL